MKNRDPKQLSERDMLKVLGIGLGAAIFTACTPNNEVAQPNDGYITLEHELKDYYIIFDPKQFIYISRKYNVPDSNFQNFDMVLTNKSIGADSPIQDPAWVTSNIDKNGRGLIEVAVGTFIDEVVKITGNKPQTLRDEVYLSAFTSYGIFVGYLDLGVKRGLFSKEWADKTGIEYLNNEINAIDPLILSVNIQKPSDSQRQDPILISPLEVQNG